MIRWPREGTWIWKCWYVVAILIKPFFLRLTIEGEEHIPVAGGCVIACNHTIGADYVILGYASPRQVFYMAKAEIFEFHPLVAAIVSGLGAFPVRRGKGDSDAIVQAVRMVDAGHVVGMFPEGTRSRDGSLQRGKTGAARIALTAQCLVVPAVVINSEPVLRDFLKFRRRPEVIMRFGAPFTLEGDAADPQRVQQATTEMMLALAALLPAERRGYYADGGS